MLLPLAQKLSKVFDHCEDLTVRTELVEGLRNSYGFDMARKESLECYLQRMLYYMTIVLPRETISGPTGCDGIPGGSRVKYFLTMGKPHG